MAEPAKRLPPMDAVDHFRDDLDRSEFAYWQAAGSWYLHIPGVGIGCLDGHDVTEHEDGTITVSPSILVDSGPRRRHGYLRRGAWEPCGDDQPPSEEPGDE